MPVAGNVTMELGPPVINMPLDSLLQAWQHADFAPKPCRAALESFMERHAISSDWFHPGELSHDGFVATDKYLFHDASREPEWYWRISNPVQQKHFSAMFPKTAMREIAHITRSLHSVELPEDFEAQFGDFLDADIVRVICSAFERTSPFGQWPDLAAAGFYRREHASVALRSGSTTILFDPQGYSGAWTTGYGRLPSDIRASVDAVLLTHGHSDHWHLPSVLRHCSDGTLVIVPDVPRVNLLTPEDFSAVLTASGQPNIRTRWYDKIAVGDFEVQPIPFFGEQPTRFSPSAREGLRNWGNCYSIRCADFSALVLADSGADPLGNMCDVVRELVARDGSYDVVLSNCLEFKEGPNLGLPTYALAIPFGRLRAIHEAQKLGQVETITSGLEGVADICVAAKAKHFLPYAHGPQTLDEHGTSDGSQMHESQLMADLELKLQKRSGSTKVSRWSVGNHFSPSNFW